MQPPFPYDEQNLPILQGSLSPTRLGRYLSIARGDLAQALRLYTWNTALSESLYGPLQGLEIALRNKIHERLTRAFSAHWYDEARVGFRHAQLQRITEAKETLRFQGKPLEPGRVVAELSFGFWVAIFGPKYEDPLWRVHLRPMFVNAAPPFRRRDAHKVLDEIRLLRNRIAHHEPILQRPLIREHAIIVMAIKWLCPTTARWIEHHSRFDEIYSAQP